ncbi:CBS domain-containing protein [Roseofilum casamattae]|uniref:CBS domain-containing protein n=1 Tax=Roseofilum casamattae BLCC-M143 TaxID=3022442 RepID=A0ABT7BYU2_9CYAN|nr:CBS domain-containing protein [Roseofilum casamattae BLCC-M143]
MDLILCHTTADFDALGAAVGLTRLKPGAQIVLAGGCHPTVREFLAFHRDEYALIERRSVNLEQIRRLIVVDTQQRDRLGPVSSWFDLPHVQQVELYDHHMETDTDIPVAEAIVEPVGATTTLVVERLQQQFPDSEIILTPAEATVMALGIHVDTGSLTFDSSTPRDALALAWLMTQGASLSVLGDYVEPGLSTELQELLTLALDRLQTISQQGYNLSWVLLPTPGFVPGLSSVASRLMRLTHSDGLLFGTWYEMSSESPLERRLTVIGRAHRSPLNLPDLFAPLGGGGHAQAASASLRSSNVEQTFAELVEQLCQQVPPALTARELMSSPVRAILPQTTVGEAARILLRYGHSGLSVVNEQGRLAGIISRRDLDLALHHGFAHAPVKGYMTPQLKTIAPETSLPEIESLMVTYDIGRLPVLDGEDLVGIVTRTDVLRQLHLRETGNTYPPDDRLNRRKFCYLPEVTDRVFQQSLTVQLREVLERAARAAQERGWHLYLVGGAVRDLLLGLSDKNAVVPGDIQLQDIDLVVDGHHQSRNEELKGDRASLTGAGVILAKVLCEYYPQARLQVHGQFQTAAVLWHNDPNLGNLWIDIATARTEFYPYPAANPQVEASSIRQDLYRRDFTINALALRLNSPRTGELLDFFGGMVDLEDKLIRVLHANSFIEDPTRIYRAVRFAIRLGFALEEQTEGYIRYAIASGVYDSSLTENKRAPALQTRLKNELHYLLETAYWKPAIQLLGNLDALQCIHSSLSLTPVLWKKLCFLDRCWHRFSLESLRSLPPYWQLLLEVIIAHLAAEYRDRVASGFQLPSDSIARLQALETDKLKIRSQLVECDLPSQIVQLLQAYSLPTLILLGLEMERQPRKKLWKYLYKLSRVKPILNGNDLKQLGYKPGREFKIILDKLREATLDGIICDDASARVFLERHFPL